MIVIDKTLAENVISVTEEVSMAIMNIYKQDFSYIQKDDKSPVTEADTTAHMVIINGLNAFSPEIPVISEEQASIPYDERKDWDYFWLVDPLDGTKEFIKRNGEFTVNIALIVKGNPVFGVVAIPAHNIIYFGSTSDGAFRRSANGNTEKIKVNTNTNEKIIAVRSRSHCDKQEEKMLSCFKEVETIYAGSSLKFCYVAQGKADIYIRNGPTMEWDTAAGQAVAESAGAFVCDLEGRRLTYNKKVLKNPGFICSANKGILDTIL
jgi:3'(2'), 5'-bisphosphate nucleotidase